jgi:hypothetical protein
MSLIIEITIDPRFGDLEIRNSTNVKDTHYIECNSYAIQFICWDDTYEKKCAPCHLPYADGQAGLWLLG